MHFAGWLIAAHWFDSPGLTGNGNECCNNNAYRDILYGNKIEYRVRKHDISMFLLEVTGKEESEWKYFLFNCSV